MAPWFPHIFRRLLVFRISCQASPHKNILFCFFKIYHIPELYKKIVCRYFYIYMFLQITAAIIFRCSCNIEVLFKEAAASSLPLWTNMLASSSGLNWGKLGMQFILQKNGKITVPSTHWKEPFCTLSSFCPRVFSLFRAYCCHCSPVATLLPFLHSWF